MAGKRSRKCKERRANLACTSEFRFRISVPTLTWGSDRRSNQRILGILTECSTRLRMHGLIPAFLEGSRLHWRTRLLCAPGLSQRSRRAVDRLALLANWVGAQLLLLHLMEPDQMIASSSRARKQIAQQHGFRTRSELSRRDRPDTGGERGEVRTSRVRPSYPRSNVISETPMLKADIHRLSRVDLPSTLPGTRQATHVSRRLMNSPNPAPKHIVRTPRNRPTVAAVPVPQRFLARTAANTDATEAVSLFQHPLWIMAIALGVFCAVAALV